jgi:hypothetical protein
MKPPDRERSVVTDDDPFFPMSTVVAGVFLWAVTVVVVAVSLTALGLVPAGIPVDLTAALLGLGGLLGLLVAVFVAFFDDRESRLFL